jgi:hypothetical protein
MRSLFRHRRRLLLLAAAACVAVSTTGTLGAGAAVWPISADSGGTAVKPPTALPHTRPAAAIGKIYATLYFSRSEITGADACTLDNSGIARLDTMVAPYLHSLRMAGTGSLVTGKTHMMQNNCTHNGDSLTVSWTQATRLAQTYGWHFVSATATYPGNLTKLPPLKQQAETCGSANTIHTHGLPGAHGLIAYPGAKGLPITIQAKYGARCFAWGREYGRSGTTAAGMGAIAPYWQFTRAFNGGPCNDPVAACYTMAAQGSTRYATPGAIIALVKALQPGQWLSLQSYLLVTGKNPPYAHNGTRWNCTSPNPALHWTNDVERYCYNDFQKVVQAIKARGITVTDPLTVGVADGRPASYP